MDEVGREGETGGGGCDWYNFNSYFVQGAALLVFFYFENHPRLLGAKQ